jgi:SAM-dependent methyltransferase
MRSLRSLFNRKGGSIQFLKGIDMRQQERTSLNRLCDIRDWEAGGVLSSIMEDLREGCYIHRKSWEYAMCIHGLETLGVVTPSSCAISVGAGYEKDNLQVLRMDGTKLDFDDEIFDFAFSLSSIEHFGSRDNIKKAMSELFRVIKPNGVLCLTTELILNNSHHQEYFSFDELKEYILGSTKFQLVGGDIDLSISNTLFNDPIDISIEKNLRISPHIILKDGEVIWTSIALFLRKPMY